MTDLKFFIRHGWNNIWKQKTIWLFSAFYLPFYCIQFIIPKQVLLLYDILLALVYLVNAISVPYDAYCYTNGNEATVRGTLIAVRKFIGRMFGCALLVAIPCLLLLCSVVTIFMGLFKISDQNSTSFSLFPLFVIFVPLVDFSLAEFFAKNVGIRQALWGAWALIKKHFPILILLAIIRESLTVAYNMVGATFIVLFQPGFNLNSLSKVNYLNPYAPLSGNIFYTIIASVAVFVIPPFSASVFMLAYQKYSEAMSTASTFSKV